MSFINSHTHFFAGLHCGGSRGWLNSAGEISRDISGILIVEIAASRHVCACRSADEWLCRSGAMHRARSKNVSSHEGPVGARPTHYPYRLMVGALPAGFFLLGAPSIFSCPCSVNLYGNNSLTCEDNGSVLGKCVPWNELH
jgi:hypothetical protein